MAADATFIVGIDDAQVQSGLRRVGDAVKRETAGMRSFAQGISGAIGSVTSIVGSATAAVGLIAALGAAFDHAAGHAARMSEELREQMKLQREFAAALRGIGGSGTRSAADEIRDRAAALREEVGEQLKLDKLREDAATKAAEITFLDYSTRLGGLIGGSVLTAEQVRDMAEEFSGLAAAQRDYENRIRSINAEERRALELLNERARLESEAALRSGLVARRQFEYEQQRAREVNQRLADEQRVREILRDERELLDEDRRIREQAAAGGPAQADIAAVTLQRLGIANSGFFGIGNSLQTFGPNPEAQAARQTLDATRQVAANTRRTAEAVERLRGGGAVYS